MTESLEGGYFDVFVDSNEATADEVASGMAYLYSSSASVRMVIDGIRAMGGNILISVDDDFITSRPIHDGIPGNIDDIGVTSNPIENPGYDARINLPTGGYDGDDYAYQTSATPKFDFASTLGHELFHAYVAVYENRFGSLSLTNTQEEDLALSFENLIRTQLGLPERDSSENYSERSGSGPYFVPEGETLPTLPPGQPAIPPIPGRKPEPPTPGFWKSAWNGAMDLISPLVLDLDGDGIELVSLANATHYFDLDVDGMAEATGWVGADDGLLAIDLNADGLINDRSELFGSETLDGFTLLAPYDSNSDGAINASDAQWGSLLVWKDTNGNGYSESAELQTLAQAGIQSISLSAVTEVDYTLQGNHVSHESTFTINTAGGVVTRTIVDAWFAVNQTNTAFVGEYTLDYHALFMPMLRGAGNLPDLYIAMSQDNTGTGNLLGLVDTLSDVVFTALFISATDTLVTSILYRWAGVDPALATNARGGNLVDAKHLEFLEELFGEEFLQRGHDANPGWDAAREIESIWTDVYATLKAQLLAQAAGAELFAAAPTYDIVAGTLTGAFALSQTAIDDLETAALALASGDRAGFWKNVAQFVQYTKGDVTNATEEGWLDTAIANSNTPGVADWDAAVALLAVAGNNQITGTTGADTLTGTAGHDTITGLGGADTLSGAAGNDRLEGGAGADTLTGGTGNDTVIGGTDSDTYIYDSGDDALDEGSGATGTDILRINDNTIGVANLSFERSATDDLFITVGTLGVISIASFFSAAARQIETLEFTKAGETSIDLTALNSILTKGSPTADILFGVTNGGNRNDTIYGYAGNDTIQGLAGNDTLFGGDDQDELTGGDGNDTLHGESGHDELFGSANDDTLYGGTGNDELDGGSGNDTLEGGDDNDKLTGGDGTDILKGDAGNDVINDTNTSGATVYGGAGNDIINAGGTLNGDAGNDTITGNGGVDTINGGDDNDTIDGKGGADIIHGDAGNDNILGENGNDTVYGDGGDDTLDGQVGLDTVYGGAGNDRVYGGEDEDSVYGEDGDDTLDGGDEDDILQGGTGSDTYVISGSHNGDTLTDTSGTKDYLDFRNGVRPENLIITTVGTYDLKVRYTGSTVDYVTIVDQRNTGDTKQVERVRFDDMSELDLIRYASWVFGTANADAINGANNVDDIIIGLGGNDNLKGFSGNDQILGGLGDDTIDGGMGNDEIYGGDGNDTLKGWYGDDLIVGGAGDDTITNMSGSKIIVGGSGSDSMTGANGADILYDVIMSDSAVSDPLNMDGADDSFAGSSGNDTFIIQARNNSINGGDGDDTYKIYLHAPGTSGSTNVVSENTGNDTIVLANLNYHSADWYFKWVGYELQLVYTGTTTNSLVRVYNQFLGYDGAGVPLYGLDQWQFADSVSFDFRTYVMIEGTSYADTINTGADEDYIITRNGGDTVNSGDGNDFVIGGSGNDTLNGQAGDDQLFGQAGADTLSGGDGSDRLNSEDGDDTLYGDAGNDYLWGGNGSDTVYGGVGDDSVNGDDGGNTDTGSFDTLFGGDGNDYVSDRAGASLSYGGDGDDTILGGDGDDTIHGDAGNDNMRGENNNDTMYGGDGNDTMYGEKSNDTTNVGHDVLFGGAGADSIYGNSGDDTLYGQGGVDNLFGNAGADNFVFEAATAFSGSDYVYDFSLAQNDKIDISDVLESVYDPLTDVLTDFVQITDNGTHSYLRVDITGTANFGTGTLITDIRNVTGLTDEAALVTSGHLVVS